MPALLVPGSHILSTLDTAYPPYMGGGTASITEGVRTVMGDPPTPGRESFSLLYASVEDLDAFIQGVVSAGVVVAFPPPVTMLKTERVVTLFFLHPHFACRVEDDDNMYPIWGDMAR